MPFPERKQQVKELVDEHVAYNDEKPILAIYFASSSAPQDECLFEVIATFGFGEVSDDHEIMQIAFSSSADFPLPPTTKMRIWATNPVECRVAIKERWRPVVELLQAIRNEEFECLYIDGEEKDATDIAKMLNLPLVII
jgi:hypothetical protein